MKQPLVSVIVPTKNSAEFIEACLRSIKGQTYKEIELIVVDNFSTDDTPTIAKQYADKFFSRGPERSAQRNYGVQKSTGSYVAIIDSDMELTPKVIESCVGLISENSRSVIIPEESFGQGFWAQCKKLEKSFYVGVDWMEGARFFDKTVYDQVGGYNEDLISGEDWDLSQRIGKLTKHARTNQYIRHNEGHLKLSTTLKKKYFYASQIKKYMDINKESGELKSQAGPIARYWLYFSHPAKLFKNPLLGISMLFMKTSEFAFGAIGLLRTRLIN